jgi:hypothetical protein
MRLFAVFQVREKKDYIGFDEFVYSLCKFLIQNISYIVKACRGNQED